MLRTLKNPRTKEYKELKKFILSNEFAWYWQNTATDGTTPFERLYPTLKGEHENFGLLFHQFIARANERTRYPHLSSSHFDAVQQVVLQILDYNNIGCDVIYRMAAQMVFPTATRKGSVPHCDHDYPHENVLMYLSDTDGETVCGEEEHHPKEDDVIIFRGEHYHRPPSAGRRIIIIATFLNELTSHWINEPYTYSIKPN